jgi:hypothetical protein
VAQAGSRRPHVIFTMAIAMRFRGFELKVCRRVAQRTGPTSGTEIRCLLLATSKIEELYAAAARLDAAVSQAGFGPAGGLGRTSALERITD